MAKINLLPWRTERRRVREREFYLMLGAAALAALAAFGIWWYWMGLRIDNQEARNNYLRDQIKQLDTQLAEIKELDKTKSKLLARKAIIEQLQASRSQMVHLFDELVKTIPSSARLTALKQSGQSMSLDGVAQSNASVAEYMRNIEASPWMGHADLRKTENTHDATRMPYTFGLNVALSRPKTDETDAGKTAVEPADSTSSANPAVPATPGTAAKAMTSPPAAVPTTVAKPSPEATPTSAAAAKGGAGS